ncbi:MAG: glycosyltransferase [Rikenellaceae bacterium]
MKSLDLDDKRVAVCMPLQTVQYSHVDYHPTSEQMMAVRNKLGLPESYILIAGDADTMHDHGVILHAIFSLPLSLGVVVYTRRTTHSEVLLKMVRDSAAADRVQFVYEITELDLCSLYRMALLMIYMPSVESSVMPIVGALHQGVPMILSDTPTNREAAGGAAMFVPPHDQEAIAHAIKSVVYSESFRGQLIAQCWAEAKRYSQENIAEQLAKIYESAW